jgi:hypothetical protein
VLLGRRLGWGPWAGLPTRSLAAPLPGLSRKFREFGASPPELKQGRRGLGGARASRAARLRARARSSRPRAAASPPAAARPLPAAAGSAGPAPSRAAAVTCRPRRPGYRCGGAPAGPGLPPALAGAQSFSLRSSCQRGPPPGVRRWRAWRENAHTRLGHDSVLARLSGHVHNFAAARSGRRGAGRGRGAGASTSAPLEPKGFASYPKTKRCSSPGPEPGAVHYQPRLGGCSCAQERGLPPRQLGRARGSRWDHLFSTATGSAGRAVPAAPPPLQLAPS